MRLKIIYWVVAFVLIFSITSFAQISKESYKIQLKSGILTPEKALPDLATKSEILQDVLFQHEYYVILQFNSIPNHTKRTALANSGIRLMAYLGANAYTAAVSTDISTSELKLCIQCIVV